MRTMYRNGRKPGNRGSVINRVPLQRRIFDTVRQLDMFDEKVLTSRQSVIVGRARGLLNGAVGRFTERDAERLAAILSEVRNKTSHK